MDTTAQPTEQPTSPPQPLPNVTPQLTANVSTLPIRAYLDQTVVPLLLLGMTALV